jgi:hypothetical protein
MTVTYKRFLQLKLEPDTQSLRLEAKVRRVSSQVHAEGGLEASARSLIMQDIEAANVTGNPKQDRNSVLARMTDAELVRRLLEAEDGG